MRLLLIWCLSWQLLGQVSYVLHDEVPLLDIDAPQEVRVHYHATGSAKQFAKAFAEAFGQDVMFDLEQHLISADEPILAVFPALQLLRLEEERVAGRVIKWNLICAGSATFFDPWTRAGVYSATQMVEVQNQLTTDTDPQRRTQILQQSLQTALQNWIKAVVQEASQQVSPFTIRAHTLKLPRMGLFKKELGGCLLNRGYIDGLKAGMILKYADYRIRVVDVQENMSWAQDVIDPDKTIPPDLAFDIIVNKSRDVAHTTQGLKLQIRTLSGQQGTLQPDAEKMILKAYLSKHEHLEILPLQMEDANFNKEITSFYDDLNRGSKVLGTLAASQELIAQLAVEKPDLELILIPTRFDQLQLPASENFLLRSVYNGILLQSNGPDFPQQFLTCVQQTDERVLQTMKGVREADPANHLLSLSRNSLISLAAKLGPATEAIQRGKGMVHLSGHVLANGQIKWQQAAPAKHKPLVWKRPTKAVVDPHTQRKLGVFEKVLDPATSLSTLDLEDLKPGDVLHFTQLEKAADKATVQLRMGEHTAPTSFYPNGDLMMAQLAQEITKHFPQLNLLWHEGHQEDEPLLWQLVKVESLETTPQRFYFQVARRLRLGPKPDQPVWKIGKRFKYELPFDQATLGSKDLFACLESALEKHNQELAEAARNKGLLKAITP